MQDHPILGRVWLGYSPVLDRQRAPVATRLSVFPARADAAIDVAGLLAALAEVWPTDRSTGSTGLLLNIASEPALRALPAAAANWRPELEVPAFIAADETLAEPLRAYCAGGGALALRGRAAGPLPLPLHGRVEHLILDAASGTKPGDPALWIAGDGSSAGFEAAIARGAMAVIGWPFADAVVASTKKALASDVQVIVELIDRVRREDGVERLEATLKRDATVAFRLLRYLNSPAFGLTVEISSLRHALMLLGYQRLSRWLAVLLATASKEPEMRPVMFAALRRGLFFEALLHNADDAELRGELFICGMFSLLDRMLRQPFGELLKTVPVPARVAEALAGGGGPFAPYLELVRAIESESVFDIRERADALLLGPAEVNRALLHTLVAAREVG